MKKKVLLIKGGHGKEGAGEHFLKAMLSDYPKHNLFRYSLIEPNYEVDQDCKSEYKVLKTSIAKQTNLPINASLNYIKFKTKMPAILNEIEDIIQKNKIEAIWIILNSIQLITIFSKLVKQSKLPIYSQIWDTPEYLCKLGRLDYFSKRHLLKTFDESIIASKTVITISDNLGKIYREKYGVKTQTMAFNVPVDSFLYPRKTILHKDKITIIFAGSLYAIKEWKSFIKAIEKWNLQSSKPTIELICVGNQSRRAIKPKWVKFEATKPVEEVMQMINKADIAYLPYWMSKQYEYTVKTAFPSKLSLYAASGTPIFYHGPVESTPYYFFENYQIGICCNSYKKEDILNTIQSILSEKFKEIFLKDLKRAVENIFHPKASTQIFNAILQND